MSNQRNPVTHLCNKAHRIYYCADHRVVKAEDINDFTKRRIEDGESGFYYSGYVTSSFLDNKVDSSRSDFALDADLESERLDGELGWPDVHQAVNKKAKEYLSPYIQELIKQKDDRVSEIIHGEMPYLGYLGEKNKEYINHLSIDLPREKLREEMIILHAKNKAESSQNFQSLLGKIESENRIEEFAKFNEAYREEIKKLNEINNADLASYVLYRQKVLDVFDALISKVDDQKFEYEAGIHSLIFPRFVDFQNSAEAYSEHNLWIVDDRWSYYDYAASDLAINKHSVLLDADSSKEPDIALYNLGFLEDLEDTPHRNIAIFEFKRPGRENYGQKDPLTQVYEYIEDIKQGKIRDHRGREILITDGTCFYVYIVCDVNNDAVKKIVSRNDIFKKTPDGQGYFGIHTTFNAYIEFIPFRKVLSDAKKRNRIFFEKLGIEKK